MTRYLMLGFCLHCILAGFIFARNGNAQNNRLNKTQLSVDWEHVPMEDAFAEIEAKTGFYFTYDKNLISALYLSKQTGAQSLADLLEKISRKTELKFTRVGTNIYVNLKDPVLLSRISKKRVNHVMAFSEEISSIIRSDVALLDLDREFILDHNVAGVIADPEGNPLVGASVVVKGTQQGTLTDNNGTFSMKVPDENSVLVISYIGYETQEVQINGRSTVNISLTEVTTALDEVVVVGYGTQGRGTVTSAIDKINGDEIATLPVVSPTQAIQGRSAGVVVTNQGAPGQDPVIRIRGLTTPNNNNPLIVIDGVPAGGLASINPSDVESIEVLKDASAASIYGSRAAGGVILITTKRGKSGAPKLTFDAYVGTQSAANRLDLLNTAEYIEIMSEQQTNGGLPIPSRFDDASIRNTDIDWQDEVFTNGVIQNYNLGISGGNNQSKYLVSFNYMNQEGIVKSNDFERYSARINTDFTLFDKVRVGQSLVLAYTNRNNVRNQGGRGLFEHVTKMAPYLPIEDPNNLGGFNGPDQIDNNDAENPVRVLMLGENNSDNLKVLGNVFAEVEIIDGLKARTSIGVDAAYGRGFSFLPSFEDGEFHNSPFAQLSENRNTFFSPVWTNTLSFDRLFDQHQIGAVGGYEVQKFVTTTLGGAGINELTSDLQTPGSVENDDVSGGTFEDGLISYFARVNYSYGGRYLIQAAIRRDGYSRFGPNNKWGTFPSVSVGWNIARESFLESVSAISNLKLRASWGRTGNNNALGRYEYQPTVQTGYTYNFGEGNPQVFGATIPGLANEALRWETTTMTNIGADFGFLDDAITFSVEYFQNNTEDILLSVPLASSLGLDRNVRVNAGEVQSKGFEFALGLRSRSPQNELQWSIDANFATQDNEVISLGSGNPINGRSWQGDVLTRVEEGQAIYFFQGWKVDRIFQADDFNADGSLKDGIPAQTGAAPGDIKFMDLAGPADENGVPTAPDGVIDANDRTNLGSPLPTYTYGLNATLNWKNFDVALFLQGVGGNKIYKAYAYWTQGMTRVFNGEDVLLNRWTPTNTNTEVPRAVSGDPNRNARASDRFIDDGDYFRIKNLTIGYTINTSSISFLSNLRVYGSAQNLLTITGYEGYDPEVSIFQGANANNAFGIDLGQLPQAKTFTLGVQVGF